MVRLIIFLLACIIVNGEEWCGTNPSATSGNFSLLKDCALHGQVTLRNQANLSISGVPQHSLFSIYRVSTTSSNFRAFKIYDGSTLLLRYVNLSGGIGSGVVAKEAVSISGMGSEFRIFHCIVSGPSPGEGGGLSVQSGGLFAQENSTIEDSDAGYPGEKWPYFTTIYERKVEEIEMVTFPGFKPP